MSEAREIAVNMVRRAGSSPRCNSLDEARFWVKAHWPDWDDWIGHVQLDNISEAVLALSKQANLTTALNTTTVEGPSR